jgi:hypothetical protein
MNGINIQDYINTCIAEDTAVAESLVGGMAHGIMPQGEEPDFPYAIWASVSTVPKRTKDGICSLAHQVDIEVVGRDYDSIADAVSCICDALEGGIRTWNAQTEKDFSINDQDWEIGQEQFDLEHDGPYRTISVNIETY